MHSVEIEKTRLTKHNKKIDKSTNHKHTIFNRYLCNKTRHSYIILRIAGQTAGPIGLNLFVDTQGGPLA